MDNKGTPRIGNGSKSSYAQILSGPLAEYVAQDLERPSEQQNDLSEEVALTRAAAMKAIETFNLAIAKDDPQAIFVSGEMMKKQLFAVATMVKNSVYVQGQQKDTMTRAGMENIIAGIIDIIFAVLRTEKNGLQLAAEIEKEIQSKIDLRVDRGTVSLPSDDMVKLMDLTVGEM